MPSVDGPTRLGESLNMKNPPSTQLGPAHAIGTVLGIPMPNGLFAAVWVLDLTEPFRMGRKLVENLVGFIVLEGHWDAVPTQREVLIAGPATLGPSHHATNEWKGCFFGPTPGDFVVVGTKPPTQEALALVAESSGTMVFQNAEHLRSELYSHWRLKHDRAAVEEEWRQAEVARKARDAERRAKMTLPEMLKEKPFGDWREQWGLSVVRKARGIFNEATQALIALNGGTEQEKTAILKAITTQFNGLYDQTGCIETGEANEIVNRVEELATIVGVSNDGEALTGHRDW